tara:strand:+ start:1120 stop:1305 length:186 start_codon:yes stop_codon:yes gene_type:complete
MIVISLPKGYLGKNMELVTCMSSAEQFNTKAQAERKIARVKKKRPEFDISEHSFMPAKQKS